MKDSYQKICLSQFFFVSLQLIINQIISKDMKEKIEQLFGWLFIITILLLWPVFLLNGLLHNVRRLFDRNYHKKWSDIAEKINGQLSDKGEVETPS